MNTPERDADALMNARVNSMATLQTASMIAAAVRAARARTKDASIGVAVRAGKYQLQRITYRASGCANVEPRSSFIPADEMVALLNSL